jgi:hypothetical protein
MGFEPAASAVTAPCEIGFYNNSRGLAKRSASDTSTQGGKIGYLLLAI